MAFKSRLQYLVFFLLISLYSFQGFSAVPFIKFSERTYNKLNEHPWQFYFEKTYQEVKENASLVPVEINIPGNWADEGFSRTGYGTYVFKFTHNQLLDSRLSLKLYTIACSHQLFVNGKLLRETGIFSTDANHAKPDFHPYLISFEVETDTVEIAIQVSNFQYRNGGLWFTPAIGLPQIMEISDKRNSIVEAFLFGSLFLLFSYFLSFYYTKTSDKTSLYFALTCLFAAIRIGSTGEILLRQISIGFPWEVIVKLEYISLVLMLLFGFLYLRCLFPRDFNSSIFKGIQVIQISACFLFLFLPVFYASFAIPYYLIFCGLLLAYMLNLVVKINLVKRPYAMEVGLATFLVIVAGVNDIFYSQAVIKTFYAMPLGILIYAIIQAMVITRLFSNTFTKVELLSNELLNINKNQQEIIEKRTAELNQNTVALEQSNQIKDKVFSIIAHDLRAPIKSLSTVLAWVAEDDLTYEELKKSLSNISKNVDTLNLTLENLLQWSRSQLNGVKSEPELIDIRRPIQEMMDLFKIQLGEKTLVLKYDNSQRHAVFIDKHHLNLLFRNLLSNAIKFSHAGSAIEIVAKDISNNQTLIEIIDSGIGMNQEALDKVFSSTDHYSTYGTKNERGTGLGLLLCKEYIENGGGKIWIESKEGKGTKISFVLPNISE